MTSVQCDVIGHCAGGGQRRRTRLWGVLLPGMETRIGMQVCGLWLLWAQFRQLSILLCTCMWLSLPLLHLLLPLLLFPLSPSPYSSLPHYLQIFFPNFFSLCIYIVATIVGGNRTPQQCLHRWKNSLHPGIKKGRWSPEEDEVFFFLFVSLFLCRISLLLIYS